MSARCSTAGSRDRSAPVATFTDATRRRRRVFVERDRRLWAITVRPGGHRVDTLVDAPDAEAGAIAIAIEYAANHDRAARSTPDGAPLPI